MKGGDNRFPRIEYEPNMDGGNIGISNSNFNHSNDGCSVNILSLIFW